MDFTKGDHFAATRDLLDYDPKPQVFISYAREDLDAAQRLYSDLRRNGFRPWLDKTSLLPGQRWKVEIRKAIRRSDYVVALLSSNSVSKRGYVQRELKEALEILDEHPEGQIFLIPARLEECEPYHEALRDLHWIDLFPSYEESLKEIIQAIRSSLDLPGYLVDAPHKASDDWVTPLQIMRRDDDWVTPLQGELLATRIPVEDRVLTPHDVFMAVFEKLLTGVPAERLGMEVAVRLGLSGRYYRTESAPEPFDRLLAPLVGNDLVRIQKRVSGVRVVLFATDRGQEYGKAFS